MLTELGRAIIATIRTNDIPCRYGGKEFAVILPGADREEASSIADRLRQNFGLRRITIPQHGSIGTTISLGVAQLTDNDQMDALFERTDKALYQAKSQGRNQVVSL